MYSASDKIPNMRWPETWNTQAHCRAEIQLCRSLGTWDITRLDKRNLWTYGVGSEVVDEPSVLVDEVEGLQVVVVLDHIIGNVLTVAEYSVQGNGPKTEWYSSSPQILFRAWLISGVVPLSFGQKLRYHILPLQSIYHNLVTTQSKLVHGTRVPYHMIKRPSNWVFLNSQHVRHSSHR